MEVKCKNNLTKKQALQIINAVENDSKLTPYTEFFSGKTLISEIKIKEEKITKIETNKMLGATTFTLSNGIKVHYKFANKQKDKVSLNAISYGGKSLLKDQDLPSASELSYLFSSSGLGIIRL